MKVLGMSFDFDALTRGIDKLAKELRDLQSRLDTLTEQRRELDVKPLPRSDVQAAVDEWLEDEAAKYGKHVRPMLAHYFGSARQVDRNGASWPPPLMSMTLHTRFHDRAIAPAIFWACRDQIRSALHAELERMDWSAAGPPLAQRDVMRAKLDKEILDLESQIEKLREHANRAGLNI